MGPAHGNGGDAHQGPGDLLGAQDVAGVPGGPDGHTGGAVKYPPLEIGVIVGNLINVVSRLAGTITMIVALSNPLTQPYLSDKARVCFPIRLSPISSFLPNARN